jgi:aminopeptidase N
VLFDPATSADSYRNRVAYVVAHELAHQWFGNLVTMDWWSELWLNEGFATWVGWLAIDHLYPGMYITAALHPLLTINRMERLGTVRRTSQVSRYLL